MYTQKIASFYVVLILIFVFSCQTKVDISLSSADVENIKKVTNDAIAIANAAELDWAAYTKIYYAPDAVIFSPNMPPVKGHEAIISNFNSFPPVSNMKFEQIEVAGAGKLAYVWGTYSFDILPEGAESPVHDTGNYIEIWQKQDDGSWLIIRDIFNSDLPIAE
jgi:ketosteroid isomerase-like protein